MNQFRAILWAQLRTYRNALPRTGAGSIVMWLLSALWYGGFVFVAVILAIGLPAAPKQVIATSLPGGLLGVLFFWQVVPILIASGGLAMDFKKLYIYPIPSRSLFSIELLLRITTAPEMMILIFGAMVGLLRHSDVPVWGPGFLLPYISFNLFLSIGIRDLATRVFRRRHLRVFALVVVLAVSVVPQLLVNTGLGTRLKPVFTALSNAPGTPWAAAANLALGISVLPALLVLTAWLVASYYFGRRQFAYTLAAERASSRSAAPAVSVKKQWGISTVIFALPDRLFPDPLAALIEKEMLSLARAPRFRVMFAMACIFSVVVFLPMGLRDQPGDSGMAVHYLPLVSCYGLLIAGEVIIWNLFGFDRKATQLYFVTPVPLSLALRAKNIVATACILLQVIFTIAVAALFQIQVTVLSIISALALVLVILSFLLGIGNLISVLQPKPVDPNETFRASRGGKAQLWLFLTLLTLSMPVGLAFLARWALDAEWAYFAVLAVDLLIGLIVYHIATDSAVAKAEHNREQIVDAVSFGSNPID